MVASWKRFRNNEDKGEIQSRTNLNGGELERIESRNGKEFEVSVKKDNSNNQSKILSRFSWELRIKKGEIKSNLEPT